MQGIAARRENTEVAFYSPASALSKETLNSINESLNSNKIHVTAATFYRILAADLLPPDAHRALYLDGDTVCASSLDELFATDLKGCPVGMCPDPPHHSSIDTYNRLGYPPQDGYFIDGVALLDLDAWRRDDLTQSMLKYLRQNAKKLLWHDMDLVNAVLHGKIFPLDFSADVLPSYFHVFYWLKEEENGYFASKTQFLLKDEWGKLKASVEHPVIVHFPGGQKPWHRDCPNPFAAVWRYFYAQSPWAGEPLKWSRSSAKAAIRRLGRGALERLKLVSPSAAIPYPQEAEKIAQRVLDELMKGDSGIQRLRDSEIQ